MVSEVSLTKQMKGSGEEQSHESASRIINPRLRKQDAVLGFMNYGIDRVHQDPEKYSQQK